MLAKVLIWIVLVIVVIYLLIGLFFYFFQFKFLFLATPLPLNYKYSFQDQFEEVSIEAEEGSINGLHFKSKAQRGCVVYFHGNAGNLSQWGNIASDFTEKGFDLLLVDYPTFGKSSGRLNEKTLIEMGRRAYEYAMKNFPENKLVLYGRSMGTGIASKVASEKRPGLLVLETPYINIKELVDFHAPWFVPTSLILRLAFNNEDNLKKVDCPVYIFHGTNDLIIPYKQSEELFRNLKNGDHFITIHGGGHNNLSNYKKYHSNLIQALSLLH